MCAATRFLKAIPLRNITARSVVRALTRFFSTFGLPCIIQTDQGTNFKSTLFKQILATLQVQHVFSSSYHPQSQGALERWHQTLKSMLRKYCTETGLSWTKEFLLLCLQPVKQYRNPLVLVPPNLYLDTHPVAH